MLSRAFTLFGLLALSSGGLLTPNTPSNLYLPVPSTQQQTNTITRTSHSIQVPAAVISSQQIPAVSTVIHQQSPAVRSSVVSAAQQTYTAGVPSVASTFIHQYPQTAQQVTVHAKSSQPIQPFSVPYVHQQVSNFASQQAASTRQSNFGTQQSSSTVNRNALLRTSQPAHTNAGAIPVFHSAGFQQVPIKQIAILRLANENVGDGTYAYNYETENGISAEEHGHANIAGAESVERVHGSYSYTGPDGVHYTVKYVADENGYHAEGAHLPVPPEPVAPTSQVTYRTSQVNSNVVGSQSAGVHVIPTTVISQPIQIVQNPGVQSQRQAATLRTSYQQNPVVKSSHNIFSQATGVPSGVQSFYQGSAGFSSQQVSADSFQSQNNQVPSSVNVQVGSTGSSQAVQTQVLQRQSTVIPNTLAVQHSVPSHQEVSEAIQSTVVVPVNTVQNGASGYSTKQADAVQTQVLQQQSAVFPSSVTVQNAAVGNAGVQHATFRQSTASAPASSVSIQHGSTGYSTQQIGVGSINAQQSNLQRQAPILPVVQQGAQYNAQQFGHQAMQAQQDVVQNQNKVSFGFVSAPQNPQAQQPLIQNLVAPSNSDSVHQSSASEQSGVDIVQSTAVPSSTVSFQQGFAANNVYSAFQKSQAAVPSGVVQVQLGRTGLINQRKNIQAQQATQRQTSGVSSSHVTVQLGTAGYATEQVGDVSSVQVFGGSPVENAAVPTNAFTNVQQVSQQAVVSSHVVPSTVSEQQTTTSNQETTVTQGVVLPDGSVHQGY